MEVKKNMNRKIIVTSIIIITSILLFAGATMAKNPTEIKNMTDFDIPTGFEATVNDNVWELNEYTIMIENGTPENIEMYLKTSDGYLVTPYQNNTYTYQDTMMEDYGVAELVKIGDDQYIITVGSDSDDHAKLEASFATLCEINELNGVNATLVEE